MSDNERRILAATPKMVEVAKGKVPVAAPPAKPVSQLQRSTRVGEVYWCAFSPHNLVPEFDDKHLVVILRGGKKDNDAHVVVPLTKQPQVDNPHGYRLTHNPNPGSANQSWAVCNHVYTVASERLEPLRDAKGVKRTPEKLDPNDLFESAGV